MTPPPPPNPAPPILAARNLVKRFGPVVALNGVPFDVRPGEVHTLCGENGAGKSTFIKLLGGIHPAGTYDGDVLVDGRVARFHSPRAAERAGVSVIYPELALVPGMTVAENIYLGTAPRRLGGLAVDWPRVSRGAGALLDRFGLGLRPDARVADLGIGHRQLVEIAVAVYWLMGTMIVRQPVPAFIITLGGMLVFRGLHWTVIANATVPVTRGGVGNLYSALTTYHLSPTAGYVAFAAVAAPMAAAAVVGHASRRRAGVAVDAELAVLRTLVAVQVVLLGAVVCNGYQGVPLSVLILGAVAVTVSGVTRHTPVGRYLYAIGGNEEAAVVSGVPVAAVTVAAFAAMGFLAAVTGFLQTAYAGASTTTVGQNMELDAIAACVIGGTSLKGGCGTVGGVLVGSLVIAVLINGMTLMAYGPEAKYVLRGAVLVAAVWADVRLGRR